MSQHYEESQQILSNSFAQQQQNLKNQLQQRADDVFQLQIALEEVRLNNASMEKENKNLQNQLAVASRELQSFTSRFDELEAHYASEKLESEGKLHEAQTTVNSQDTWLKQLREKLDAETEQSDAQKRELQRRISELEQSHAQKVSQLSQDHSAKLADLEKRLSELLQTKMES